jgi:hypothetical protein
LGSRSGEGHPPQWRCCRYRRAAHKGWAKPAKKAKSHRQRAQRLVRRQDNLYRRIALDAVDGELLERLQAQGYRLTVDHAPGNLFNTTWMLAQGGITIKRWSRKPTLQMELEISLFKKRERLEVAKASPKAAPDGLVLVSPSNVIRLDWEIFPPGTVDEVVRFF